MSKIGNIEINGRVILSPMAGITFLSYRNFMKDFGVALTVTEMVSDCGIIYQNEETMRYLITSLKERPVAIQLFGGKEETLVEAIRLIESKNIHYDILDINLGCPVKKVTKTGAGSAWLTDLTRLKNMMTAVCRASKAPVTAKIRLGWDESTINVREVIKILEEAGVKMIAIHARTTKQLYSGLPNFETIRGIRQEMNIPLAISGNIYTLEDAINAINITGADYVMVARGGVGNPHLIKEIYEYYKTGTILEKPSIEKQKEYCLNLGRDMVQEMGEKKAMMIYRAIAPKFFNGYANMKELKGKLTQNLNTYADLVSYLGAYIK